MERHGLDSHPARTGKAVHHERKPAKEPTFQTMLFVLIWTVASL